MSMPTIGIVVHEPLRSQLFSVGDLERLGRLARVKIYEGAGPMGQKEAATFLADCDAAIGSWGTPWPSGAVVSACPSLRLWVHAAGSVKRMFGPHLAGRGLTIASCAPAIAENVAEMTLGCLIVGLKRILENAAANRLGIAGKVPNARAVGGCTIGVIGASQVGRRVIRNLRPLGGRILLFDPFVRPAEAAELGAELRDDLVALCRESDAITLHTPLLPATTRMIGPTQLAALRDDAVIVNTSRGGCVDEPALITELEKGRFFAFLDVTDPEPAAPDSPLRRLPNVVLTSHIAGGPDHKIGRQAVDDVEAFFSGRSPAMVVTADMLDRLA